MSSALIGHTGFVGSNLMRQRNWHATFNSKNIHEIEDQHFDLAVCCGVSAVKWKANADPESDWQNILTLFRHLRKAQIERMVLISTIDVYPKPFKVDETTPLTGIEDSHAYGRHRSKVEDFVHRFPSFHVIRLPALFGPGLKKNVIYDLMNDNILDKINPKSQFQWYPLKRLWGDMKRVIDQDIRVINFATQPLATQLIISHFFKGKEVGTDPVPQRLEDVGTVHAEAMGKPAGRYLYDVSTIIKDMEDFLR